MPATQIQEQRQSQQKNKHFWSFRAAVDKSTPPELILYGDISSESWWGDEVTPRQFSKELNALGNVPEIVVRINSGGGDVFAANAIYTRLKDHKAKITVKIDGWAASAATIIAMSADEGCLEIPGNGVFMVHEAKMGLRGYYGKDDFVKMTEEITVINNSIVNGYALKTGKTPEEIAVIMAATTWMDGKQAVEAGFCDKLMFEEVETAVENASKVIVNSVPLDLSFFPDMPVSLLNRIMTHTKSGFSNTQDQSTTEKERKTMPENKEIKTVDELKAAFPALTAQIAKDATDAERTRIQDIEGVALAGFETIVNDAKFMHPIAAGDLAKAIVAEQKKQGETYLAKRDADAESSGASDTGVGAQEGRANNSGANEVSAAIDAIFPKTRSGGTRS